MKLILQGHDERYVVEQGMLNLFPGEKPVYEPILPEDDTWAVVSLREDDLCHVTVELSYRGKSAPCSLDVPLTGDSFQREGLRRRAIGRCFFLAARAVTGSTPPWGMLTGVRPVKLPTRAIAAGATPEQAQAMLEKEYCLSSARARLAVDCATASVELSGLLAPEEVSLYVGIPFCPTRCAYCSFVSADVGRSLGMVVPFLDCLERELASAGESLARSGRRIRTIYMGGGTPTTLTAEQLHRLLTAMEAALDLSSCVEFTVEAGRPDTITREKMAVLAAHGVGRVSVNPQTMEDHVLSAMGRSHRSADILRAYEDVRRSGAFHVNMDLIAGLPQDTPEGFSRSLNQILALRPENITVHTLALKKGSALMGERGALPSPEAVAAMLDRAWSSLEGAGYVPYYLYRQKYMSGGFENIGWCLPGHENQYNIIMMEELHTVLSLGGGGMTKLVDRELGSIRRINNPKYPKEYIERIDAVCAEKEKLEWPIN